MKDVLFQQSFQAAPEREPTRAGLQFYKNFDDSAENVSPRYRVSGHVAGIESSGCKLRALQRDSEAKADDNIMFS